MARRPVKTKLPLYRNSLSWSDFEREYPAPDVFAETVFRWPASRIRQLQNDRFLTIVKHAWGNGFYQRLWGSHGIEPGDIKSLEDIEKLPIFNSDDIKNDQQRAPPFGAISGIKLSEELQHNPLKIQTSGGTTGKARPTLNGVLEWEMNGLLIARSLYLQGARPGDVMQITGTNSLANYAWCYYHACHNYLGVLPVTTGSGVVTPSLRQIEVAFDFGVNLLTSFPEYLTQLASVAREEYGRDLRELKLKFVSTYLGPDTAGLLRKELEDMLGCPAYDNYGTNELSHASFEGPDKDGLYINEDAVFLEILDTESNKPVATGESGNIVATSLYRNVLPLIRFNLRDLGRILPSRGASALGSHFRRMDHFLGRSDDMVKIRGTNVYPMACLNAVRSDARTTGEWVCIAVRQSKDGVLRDDLVVRVEVKMNADRTGLEEGIQKRLQVDLGLKCIVELADEGEVSSLLNVGKEGKVRRLIDRRNLDGKRK